MHISWAGLASFCQLGFISDPLIVSKFHNKTRDSKGQEHKIYTIVKGRETFYLRHTVPVPEAVKSSDLVVQLKLKFLLMKPTHDDIIEAKEVYIQLSFVRYKLKLMLRN